MKYIVGILTLLIMTDLCAQTSSTSKMTTMLGTIPIIGPSNKASTQYGDATAASQTAQPYETQKLGDANIGEAVSLIKGLRNDLCSNLGKNDEIKLFLNWDAKAKVFGIGVGMNTGIEVNIKCDSK